MASTTQKVHTRIVVRATWNRSAVLLLARPITPMAFCALCTVELLCDGGRARQKR